MSDPDNFESFKGKLGNINNTVEEFRSGCVPGGKCHSIPSLFTSFLAPVNDWLHFNLEAGNRFRKFILMLQPGPLFSGDRASPLDTPGPLFGKGWSGGGLRGGRGAGGAPRRGPSACGPPLPRQAGREDRHLAGGGPRCGGPGWRRAPRPTPGDLTDPVSPL